MFFFWIDPPPRKRKIPTPGCRGQFWSKNIFQLLACNDTIKKKNRIDPSYEGKHKKHTSGCPGDFWSKGVFLILFCDDTIKN